MTLSLCLKNSLVMIIMMPTNNIDKCFEVICFRFGSRKCILTYEKSLQRAIPLIKQGLLMACKLLSTKNDIIINIQSTKDKFIKNRMGGVTGSTLNECALFLSINGDPALPGKSIIGRVVHEYSHAIRLQRIGRKGNTIRDGLASEGLAQCFVEEVTGSIDPWSRAITCNQAQVIWTKLKRKLDVVDKNLYDRVFFKLKDKEFPHWSGYTIGYLLLRKRLSELGKDWNDVIGMRSVTLVGKGIT